VLYSTTINATFAERRLKIHIRYLLVSGYFTFCPPCGAPVMEFLKERGLIESEVLEYLERKEIMRQ
jgi:hypothetical protein